MSTSASSSPQPTILPIATTDAPPVPVPGKRAAYVRQHPQRSPCWRYVLMLNLLQQRVDHVSAHQFDAWLSQLYPYVRALRSAVRSRQTAREWRVREAYPALSFAYDIYNSRNQRDACELEGLILAGVSDEAISATLNVSPDTVKIYEGLFFNVRDKLAQRGYIANNVILPIIAERSNRLLARFFGYFGGQVVLESVLHRFSATQPRVISRDEVQEFMDQFYENSVRRVTAINLLDVEDRQEEIPLLFDVHTRLLLTNKQLQQDAGDLQQTQTERQLQALLEALPRTPAEIQGAMETDAFDDYHKASGGARMRDEELRSGASADDLETVKFPEPRPKKG